MGEDMALSGPPRFYDWGSGLIGFPIFHYDLLKKNTQQRTGLLYVWHLSFGLFPFAPLLPILPFCADANAYDFIQASILFGTLAYD